MKKYSRIIRQELERLSSAPTLDQPGIFTRLIVNKDETEFLLITIGWHRKQRYHYVDFHLELIDGKVLIQANNTDYPMEERLVELGIREEDIVCTFLSEEVKEMEEREMALV